MYLPTFTGQQLNCLDPKPAQIHPLDIARGLSRAGRFANQAQAFLSVAQHSLLVADIAEASLPQPRSGFVLAALLNRAPEAYTGAITGPVADALNLLAPGVLRSLQGRLRGAVDRRFGLELDVAEQVLINVAEREAEVCARQDLGHDTGGHWPHLHGVPRPRWVPCVMPMGADDAMRAFMARLLALWGAL